MRILFTICGRAGSQGIKNKNIRNFVGKPLVYYSISIIDLYIKTKDKSIQYDIAVNSDSRELLNLCSQNKLRKVEHIKRKPELASDDIAKIDVIADCLIKMMALKKCQYDVVVDLDITSPLRTVKDFDRVIEKHFLTNADVTTTVTNARRNPYFNQVIKTTKGYIRAVSSNYTARQQAPEVFDMNASIYAYNPNFLMSQKGIFEGYCECVKMYDTGILDLDHENDFELMEVIGRYLFENKIEFAEIYNNI